MPNETILNLESDQAATGALAALGAGNDLCTGPVLSDAFVPTGEPESAAAYAAESARLFAAKPANLDDAWLGALPENLRPLAGQAGSPERLESALKHGLAHAPVLSAEEVEVEAPEGLELNEEAVHWFRELAVEQGFSKSQIGALVKAYNEQLDKAPQGQRQAVERELKSLYGHEYQAKIKAASQAVRRLDALSGGSLQAVLQLGLGNHGDFIKAMVAVGEAISDSVMPGQPQGGGGSGPMSAEAFMAEIFKSNKRQ